MHDRGKSDSPVVPAKLPNKPGEPGAEVVEGRGLAKGNTASKTRPGHGAGTDAPRALGRVRQVAQQDKEARFTALLHHVDLDRLRAAYWALRPKAAPGGGRGDVDGLRAGSGGQPPGSASASPWAIEPRNNGLRGADAVEKVGRQHRWWRFREPPADPARSKILCMRGISMRENREVP